MYTDDLTIKEKMGQPAADYMKNGKVIGIHYIVEDGSTEQKKIFNALKLNKTHEKKTKRERKA